MPIIERFVAAAVLAGVSLTTSTVQADDNLNNNNSNATAANTRQPDFDRDTIGLPLYRPQELDIDLFGSTALGQQTLEHLSGHRFRHHVLYGGGGGATFFFCKYVGVGGEYEADARASHFADSASGNVYLRLPFENIGLSPYVFGGGGYQFEEVHQSFGQAGGGLEYRFCHHLGVFVDGRWVFAAQTQDYGLARLGLRIAF